MHRIGEFMIKILMLLLFVNAMAFCDEPKIYISSDQIHLCDNKIYVAIDAFIYETPAIHADVNGYYVLNAAKSGHCSWYQWECSNPECQSCNLIGKDWTCKKCGKPIYTIKVE